MSKQGERETPAKFCGLAARRAGDSYMLIMAKCQEWDNASTLMQEPSQKCLSLIVGIDNLIARNETSRAGGLVSCCAL